MAISNIISNILNGIADAASARKKLLVPRTNMSDDSISVNWDNTNKQVNVVYTIDSDNSCQIIADGTNGLYHVIKEDGTWKTVPTAVGKGGTGATNAATARKNLGLISSAATTVTYNGLTFNYWTYGNVVTIACVNGTTTSEKAANVSIGTLPSAIRPRSQINIINTALTDTNERWLIQTDGRVQCATSVPAGRYVRFYATYVGIGS